MKLTYAALAALPLAASFEPARVLRPNTSLRRSAEHPVEVETSTVYPQRGVIVNSNVIEYRADAMYEALKTHKHEREARAAALEDHRSFFAGLLGRAESNERAVNPATDPVLAKAAVAEGRRVVQAWL